MEEKEVDRNTCIIVVYVRKGDTDITMGLVVDEVCEVIEVTPDQIEPAPTFGTQVDTSFILGMAKTEESVKMLLDIDMVLTEKEMAAVQQAGK